MTSYWLTRPIESRKERDGGVKPMFEELQKYKQHIMKKKAETHEQMLVKETSVKRLHVIENDADMKSFVSFLQQHYKQENGNGMSIHYTEDIVRAFFAGSHKYVCLGLYTSDNHLIATICGYNHKIMYLGNEVMSTVVNALCIHVDYRHARIAPYMIDELCDQISDYYGSPPYGLFTCAYKVNSNHFHALKHAHRPLNIDQLVKSNYLTNVNVKVYKRLYETFKTTKYDAVRLQQCDLEHAEKFLGTYLSKYYDAHFVWSKDDLQAFVDNPSFVCLKVVNTADQTIAGVMVLYLLDYHTANSECVKNAYLYIWAFEDNSKVVMQEMFEVVSNFCYKNKIADVLTFLNTFPIDNVRELKALEGSTVYYFLYNMTVPKLPETSTRNALLLI